MNGKTDRVLVVTAQKKKKRENERRGDLLFGVRKYINLSYENEIEKAREQNGGGG